MFSILAVIVEWVLGFFKAKDPKIQEIAASNATAQAELENAKGALNVEQKAAAAGIADDALQLRGNNGPAGGITTDQSAPVNSDPNAHFRD